MKESRSSVWIALTGGGVSASAASATTLLGLPAIVSPSATRPFERSPYSVLRYKCSLSPVPIRRNGANFIYENERINSLKSYSGLLKHDNQFLLKQEIDKKLENLLKQLL